VKSMMWAAVLATSIITALVYSETALATGTRCELAKPREPLVQGEGQFMN